MTALAVAAGVAVLVGAGLQAATGFGFALVAAPLLFAAATPEQAIGLLLVLGLEVNLLTLATEGRRPEVLRRDAVTLLLWSIPGLAVGIVVLSTLDATALQVLVTVGVLVSLAVRRLAGAGGPGTRRPAPRRAGLRGAAAGLASGALTTSTSTAGPPVVLFLLGRGARPEQVRDTLTFVFLGLSVLGAAALALSGTTGAVPEAAAVAALVPVVVVGHLAGRRVFGRLARGHYESVLTGTLLVAALAGLITALV